ncbi:hypothetical protein GCM10009535_59060 [Streptomyces thermocarboxydovorans]|uniref:Uncharacterized protein n=2 Tax=Streptomyces thermocarboxydovorans TaxID=59298 RepID=A0ABN1HX17_9ACTN
MPIKVLGDAERKTSRDAVDYCQSHGPGCKKHRYPHPKIWGHKLDNGRWFMTPDESLDVELTFLAEQLEMLRGISRDDFLAQPCKVIQMPRAEYRKVYGKPSDEDLKRLEESLLAHRARTTPPAFEECE